MTTGLSIVYPNVNVTMSALTSMSGGYVTRSGSNLLFSPDVSNHFYVYEGGTWIAKTIPDAGVTVGCTGLTNSTTYYLYAYDNAGTVTLDLSTTAPTTQNGIKVKTGATNRLMIARCQTNDSGAVVTANDTASGQMVCNLYNKRRIRIYNNHSTVSWSYNSST